MAKGKDKEKDAVAKRTKGGGFIPALCNVCGIVLLLAVIGLCVPLAVPNLMGYRVYEVVSGSMEPAIPVGSVIYVDPVDLTQIKEGDVIAYHEGSSIIAHRVITNRTSMGEFVTKGDANNVEDLDPIPYDAVEGKVRTHVPHLGAFMSIYSSTVGKIYLVLTAACGVMLNVLASRIRERRRRVALERELRIEQAQQAIDAAERSREGTSREAVGSDSPDSSGGNRRDRASHEADAATVRSAAALRASGGSKPTPKRSGFGDVMRRALIAVLAVVFLGSAGVIGYVTYQYSKSDALYSRTAETYASKGNAAPITIDFDSLCAENPDIVGWIYCEGTAINYPVLHGKDNDQYLYTDYTGSYNIDGSIFVDGDNRPGFADSNTIIYGHHMNSGSMFACLEDWGDQAFYEEHPEVWLLTPTQDYRIVLFAGHHVNAYSENYDIISQPGPELDSFLETALRESDFNAHATIVATSDGVVSSIDPSAKIQLNPLQDHYVMLSTCAYVFDNARYALHGVLVPASSAGGKPLNQ